MTNDPTSAAYEAAVQRRRLMIEEAIEKATDDVSTKDLIKIMDALEPVIAEAETRGRLDELSRYGYPNELTKAGLDAVWKRTDELQANADGANGRDGEESLADDLLKNTVQSPPEVNKVINEHFWDIE